MKTVNKAVPRVDAVAKVTGKAQYGTDLVADQMLYGKVLRSKVASAKVTRLDIQKALALPGVEAIITAADIPGDPCFGVIAANLPVLVSDKVRSTGDGLAVVAAKSPEIASQAVKLIEVEYQALPAVFEVEEAIKEGAVQIHSSAPNNIVAHHPMLTGDIDTGFAQADVIIEREYTTQFIEHAYIEPEAVLAIPEHSGNMITVKGSIQNPFTTRKVLAAVLGITLNKVRVIQSFMGGSFGGKDEVMSMQACRAALLALKTGRPVKMVNTREESIRESYKRHPYRMKYKVGATKDGKLTAMEYRILADSGAYESMTPFVTWRTVVQATGPYEIPHVKGDVYGVYTNNPYTGAMRGFGSPQPIFAQESLMDELALELGIDPVEIRRINGFKQGSTTATGQVLDTHQVSLMEVMEKAIAASDYTRKYAEYQQQAQTGRYQRGIGLAISYRGCSLGAEGVDATGAMVSVQTDGTVFVHSGLTENGQGLRTIFSQIASEELGISLGKVVFMDTDTSLIPDGGPTVASRSTLMGGNAVRIAASKVRETLLGVAAKLLKASSEEIVFADDKVFVKTDQSRQLSFEQVVEAAHSNGELLAALGWYKAPKVSWDEEHGKGRAYFTYVYGCQIAEVEVDTLTGKVKVLQITAAHDVGRAINPDTVRGQIYGGVVMGMGYALLEELEVHQGEIKSLNFEDYLIPGAKDIPEIIPVIVENPDGYGPYGAKTIGEPTLEITAPAISNGVFQATGRRVRSLPLNLERVSLGHSLSRYTGGGK